MAIIFLCWMLLNKVYIKSQRLFFFFKLSVMFGLESNRKYRREIPQAPTTTFTLVSASVPVCSFFSHIMDELSILLCSWAQNPISSHLQKIPVLAILPSPSCIINFTLVIRSFPSVYKHAIICLMVSKNKNPFFILLFPLAIASCFCSHAQQISLKKLCMSTVTIFSSPIFL